MKTVLCLGATRLHADGAALLLAHFGNGAVRALGLIPSDASPTPEAEILLVDLPACRGLETVRRMRAAAPTLDVIAVVDPAQDEDVLAYARAGVTGYFPKDWTPSQMVTALLDGGGYTAGRITAVLLREIARHAAPDASSFHGNLLTPREMQVLQLIEKGFSNKEIARALRVEIATVKNHVHQILSKTRARRRTQAARILRK